MPTMDELQARVESQDKLIGALRERIKSLQQSLDQLCCDKAVSAREFRELQEKHRDLECHHQLRLKYVEQLREELNKLRLIVRDSREFIRQVHTLANDAKRLCC